ncbi:YncE family protein [Bacillus atrophaeus]|uniref:YncE family protein n=1 Tax=Bacillus atrophaeus TaxID=1452 RepID=UPI00227F79E6|nr:YncE family protein [Bacillus atrophaeus]MCY9195317.1 YncE family protein [Bacillus atrophaeus]
MKKNDLSALIQENCFCFCDEEVSREAQFLVPIEVPEGFVVDPAEAVAAVTWSTDHLSCVSEPCLTEIGPDTEDIGVIYGVRLQGTITLLVSVSPVRNQYGQGNGSVSVIHTEEIDQVVYYSNEPNDCPDLSDITIENLVVVPPFYGSSLTVAGTMVLVPEPELGSYAFTANQSNKTVTIIDTNTHTVVKNISVPYTPYELGVTPDKRYTYVLHHNYNLVTVIDNTTLRATAFIPIEGRPFQIAFDPAGAFAYVLTNFSDSIYVINTETKSVERVIGNIAVLPASIAIDRTGQFAYVVDNASGSINKIDLAAGSSAGVLTGLYSPNIMAIAPNNQFAYVTTREQYDLNFNYVSVIDLNTFTEEAFLNQWFFGSPKIIFSPDSTRAYLLEPGRLHVFDTATYTEVANADLLGTDDIALTSNQEYIYATQPEQNTVTVYRTDDLSVETVITVVGGPMAIEI